MLLLNSTLKPEYDSEVLQTLVDRMVRARWIDRAMVTSFPILIEWSVKGRSRMREIVHIMKSYAPQLFDDSPNARRKIGRIKSVMMSLRIDFIAAADLKVLTSCLSSQEYAILLGLTISFANRSERVF